MGRSAFISFVWRFNAETHRRPQEGAAFKKQVHNVTAGNNLPGSFKDPGDAAHLSNYFRILTNLRFAGHVSWILKNTTKEIFEFEWRRHSPRNKWFSDVGTWLDGGFVFHGKLKHAPYLIDFFYEACNHLNFRETLLTLIR